MITIIIKYTTFLKQRKGLPDGENIVRISNIKWTISTQATRCVLRDLGIWNYGEIAQDYIYKKGDFGVKNMRLK